MRIPSGRNPYRPLLASLLLGLAVAQVRALAGDNEQPFGLADLPAEHAALAGKATVDGPAASGPPKPVSFRDLWDHPDHWRGRRVQIRGTVARVFRQGAVGSFPPLVEGWVGTPEGDLFCVVFPQAGPAAGGEASQGPPVPPLEPGRKVAFTGTFLRPIRYAAGDQPRLAPLIVGDRPPAVVPGPVADRSPIRSAWGWGSGPVPSADSWSATGWALGLALGLAAVLLAWRHVRTPTSVRSSSRRVPGGRPAEADPPLEFIRTEPADGTTLHRPDRD